MEVHHQGIPHPLRNDSEHDLHVKIPAMLPNNFRTRLLTNWISVKEQHRCSEYSTKHLVVVDTRRTQQQDKEESGTGHAEQYDNDSQSTLNQNTLSVGQTAHKNLRVVCVVTETISPVIQTVLVHVDQLPVC